MSFLLSSCPICLEDRAVDPVQLSGCHHTACRSCWAQWFQQEETTGQPAPTCAVETCRRALPSSCAVNNDVRRILGRPFRPAGRSHKKRRCFAQNAGSSAANPILLYGEGDDSSDGNAKQHDEATEKWLKANTIPCGGCEGRIMKESGCDKLQCLCGYRICWKCKAVRADCNCNPGHGFVDNITGRPVWSTPTVATKQELQDFKSYLAKKKRAAPDMPFPFMSAMPTSMVSATHRRDPFFWEDLDLFSSPTTQLSLSFSPSRRQWRKQSSHSEPQYDTLPATTTVLPSSNPTSTERQTKIIQSMIQNDVNLAMELYHAEMQERWGGYPPPWANQLSFYVRGLVSSSPHRGGGGLTAVDAAALFPGVSI